MADPFAWLTDMLTQAWGEPRVRPPSEPKGRVAYLSDADGLIWVKMNDGVSRRAWAWFPHGHNNNLAIDKGNIWAIRMGGTFQRVTIESHHGTWAGLTRDVVEPAARWVYGIKAGS